MRYAIWNNKGGVGKTFLSFMLSTEYALKHPRKKIIVVDMCPQANLSEIILGGNGEGVQVIEKFIANKKTIGGYVGLRIESPHKITGQETEFFCRAHDYNQKLPDNLYLVPGDSQLEIQAQVMNQISSQTLPEDSWLNVHSWLKDLIVAGEKKFGDTTTFIDCNPSFSSYTELALLAATQLLVPCSSDGSSARAIDNVAALVYGEGVDRGLKAASFAGKAKSFDVQLPVLRAVLLNRSTQYDKRASQAFRAMFEEIKRRVEVLKHRKHEAFYTGFKYYDIPDAHSPAIVCSHQGCPLSQLKPGQHAVHNTKPQVNPEPLDRYKKAIDEIVAALT